MSENPYQKFFTKDPEKAPDIVIQHGRAGHRHTTTDDTLGYWCQDVTCKHWLYAPVIVKPTITPV